MFRSYWLATAALGMIFLSSPVLSQERIDSALEHQPVAEVGQNEGTAAGYNASECEHKKVISLNTPSGRFESFSCDEVAKKDKAEDSGQINREIRDLEAQESMALWAKFMFWATLGSIFLGFVGIVFVWKTLKATRAAVSETRRIGEAQVRAYMSISDVTSGIEPKKIVFKFRAENSGQSPARSVVIIISTKYVYKMDVSEGNTDIIINSISSGGFENIITSGGIGEIDTSTFSIRDTEAMIWLNIIIKYQDVFNNTIEEFFSYYSLYKKSTKIWDVLDMSHVPYEH